MPIVMFSYEHDVDMSSFVSTNAIMVPFAYSYIITVSCSFAALEPAYNSWSSRPMSDRPGISESRYFLEGYIDCPSDGKPSCT